MHFIVGVGASHVTARPGVASVCGGVPDPAERQSVPRVLLHVPQALPAAFCWHTNHAS